MADSVEIVKNSQNSNIPFPLLSKLAKINIHNEVARVAKNSEFLPSKPP